jgi:hypothetical protein
MNNVSVKYYKPITPHIEINNIHALYKVSVRTGLLEAAPMTDEPLLEAQRNDPRVQSGPRIEVPEGIGQRVVQLSPIVPILAYKWHDIT